MVPAHPGALCGPFLRESRGVAQIAQTTSERERELTFDPRRLLAGHGVEDGRSVREEVRPALLDDIQPKIMGAADQLRTNHLPRLPAWCDTCGTCDLVALCRDRPEADSVMYLSA
ncbi:hypothetical protein [Luteimicrobium subarcticum]|nr:hypothetical protein [Luteimicrobium subarcticum]